MRPETPESRIRYIAREIKESLPRDKQEAWGDTDHEALTALKAKVAEFIGGELSSSGDYEECDLVKRIAEFYYRRKALLDDKTAEGFEKYNAPYKYRESIINTKFLGVGDAAGFNTRLERIVITYLRVPEYKVILDRKQQEIQEEVQLVKARAKEAIAATMASREGESLEEIVPLETVDFALSDLATRRGSRQSSFPKARGASSSGKKRPFSASPRVRVTFSIKLLSLIEGNRAQIIEWYNLAQPGDSWSGGTDAELFGAFAAAIKDVNPQMLQAIKAEDQGKGLGIFREIHNELLDSYPYKAYFSPFSVVTTPSPETPSRRPLSGSGQRLTPLEVRAESHSRPASRSGSRERSRGRSRSGSRRGRLGGLPPRVTEFDGFPFKDAEHVYGTARAHLDNLYRDLMRLYHDSPTLNFTHPISSECVTNKAKYIERDGFTSHLGTSGSGFSYPDMIRILAKLIKECKAAGKDLDMIFRKHTESLTEIRRGVYTEDKDLFKEYFPSAIADKEERQFGIIRELFKPDDIASQRKIKKALCSFGLVEPAGNLDELTGIGVSLDERRKVVTITGLDKTKLSALEDVVTVTESRRGGDLFHTITIKDGLTRESLQDVIDQASREYDFIVTNNQLRALLSETKLFQKAFSVLTGGDLDQYGTIYVEQDRNRSTGGVRGSGLGADMPEIPIEGLELSRLPGRAGVNYTIRATEPFEVSELRSFLESKAEEYDRAVLEAEEASKEEELDDSLEEANPWVDVNAYATGKNGTSTLRGAFTTTGVGGYKKEDGRYYLRTNKLKDLLEEVAKKGFTGSSRDVQLRKMALWVSGKEIHGAVTARQRASMVLQAERDKMALHERSRIEYAVSDKTAQLQLEMKQLREELARTKAELVEAQADAEVVAAREKEFRHLKRQLRKVTEDESARARDKAELERILGVDPGSADMSGLIEQVNVRFRESKDDLRDIARTIGVDGPEGDFEETLKAVHKKIRQLYKELREAKASARAAAEMNRRSVAENVSLKEERARLSKEKEELEARLRSAEEETAQLEEARARVIAQEEELRKLKAAQKAQDEKFELLFANLSSLAREQDIAESSPADVEGVLSLMQALIQKQESKGRGIREAWTAANRREKSFKEKLGTALFYLSEGLEGYDEAGVKGFLEGFGNFAEISRYIETIKSARVAKAEEEARRAQHDLESAKRELETTLTERHQQELTAVTTRLEKAEEEKRQLEELVHNAQDQLTRAMVRVELTKESLANDSLAKKVKIRRLEEAYIGLFGITDELEEAEIISSMQAALEECRTDDAKIAKLEQLTEAKIQSIKGRIKEEQAKVVEKQEALERSEETLRVERMQRAEKEAELNRSILNLKDEKKVLQEMLDSVSEQLGGDGDIAAKIIRLRSEVKAEVETAKDREVRGKLQKAVRVLIDEEAGLTDDIAELFEILQTRVEQRAQELEQANKKVAELEGAQSKVISLEVKLAELKEELDTYKARERKVKEALPDGVTLENIAEELPAHISAKVLAEQLRLLKNIYDNIEGATREELEEKLAEQEDEKEHPNIIMGLVREKIVALEEFKRTAETEAAEMAETIRQQLEQIEELKDSKRELEARLEEIEEELEVVKSREAEILKDWREICRKLGMELEEEDDLPDKKEVLAAIDHKFTVSASPPPNSSSVDAEAELKRKIEDLERKLRNEVRQKESLELEVAQLKLDVAREERRAREAERKSSGYEEELARTQQELEELQEAQPGLMAELEQLRRERQEAFESVALTEQKLSSVMSLVNQLLEEDGREANFDDIDQLGTVLRELIDGKSRTAQKDILLSFGDSMTGIELTAAQRSLGPEALRVEVMNAAKQHVEDEERRAQNLERLEAALESVGKREARLQSALQRKQDECTVLTRKQQEFERHQVEMRKELAAEKQAMARRVKAAERAAREKIMHRAEGSSRTRERFKLSRKAAVAAKRGGLSAPELETPAERLEVERFDPMPLKLPGHGGSVAPAVAAAALKDDNPEVTRLRKEAQSASEDARVMGVSAFVTTLITIAVALATGLGPAAVPGSVSLLLGGGAMFNQRKSSKCNEEASMLSVNSSYAQAAAAAALADDQRRSFTEMHPKKVRSGGFRAAEAQREAHPEDRSITTH